MQAKFIRIAIMAAVALVAAVFLVATGAFLCVALYEGLKLILSPALAALVAALALLILAWVVIAVGSAVAKAAERKARADAARQGSPAVKIGLEIGRLLGESAAGAVGKNPTKVLIGAVILGFLFGAVPKLRSFLMSLL
jgi:hypothetical protein